jgi:hypothetical protein
MVQQQPQQLQCGRVGPVQVFPYGQYRLLSRLSQQPRHQRLLRLLLLALWTQGQRWIALRHRQHEEGSQQRHPLFQGQARRPQRLLQRVQTYCGRVVAVPLEEPLEVLDNGIESAVGMRRGTAERQLRRPRVRHMFSEHAHQTGFANASLAAE